MPWGVCAIVALRHHGFLTEAPEQTLSRALLSVGFQQEKAFEPMRFEDWALVLVE